MHRESACMEKMHGEQHSKYPCTPKGDLDHPRQTPLERYRYDPAWSSLQSQPETGFALQCKARNGLEAQREAELRVAAA